jgi:hypothetical protein
MQILRHFWQSHHLRWKKLFSGEGVQTTLPEETSSSDSDKSEAEDPEEDPEEASGSESELSPSSSVNNAGSSSAGAVAAGLDCFNGPTPSLNKQSGQRISKQHFLQGIGRATTSFPRSRRECIFEMPFRGTARGAGSLSKGGTISTLRNKRPLIEQRDFPILGPPHSLIKMSQGLKIFHGTSFLGVGPEGSDATFISF